MGYRLGVDLGTTFTAAVVHRPGSEPTVVRLGERGAPMPSVLYLGADGIVLIGDAAERRALTDPERVVRRFKRRIGDETPLLFGAREGEAVTAHAVAALMIALVADRVTEREGSAPDAIAVTVPAAWGAHKKDLLTTALTHEGLLGATLVSEPAAAALAYAHTGRMDAGITVAVYDFGGGTFDAALVRTETDGISTLLGSPAGLPDLGGVDFDDAVLAHVLAAVPSAADGFDGDDPHAVTAMARLRRECVDAKEGLSVDTVVTVPVQLGGVSSSVRLTRSEFEALIGAGVEETFASLDSALDSAGMSPQELHRVLLTGGSSRIPLVTQLLSARYPGVRIERDIDPKLAVAIGGVLALGLAGIGELAVVPTGAVATLGVQGGPTSPPERPPIARDVFDQDPDHDHDHDAVLPLVRPRRRRRSPLVLYVAAALVMAGSFGASRLDRLGFGDSPPAASLQEKQVGGAERAQADRRAAEVAAEKSAADSTAAEGSGSGSTAGGSTEGSADPQAAGSPDTAPDASTAEATPAKSTAADKTAVAEHGDQAASERKAAKKKAADKADSAAATSPNGNVTTPAEQEPAAAPAADTTSADSAAPAEPARAEDTSTDSGSVETFNDGSGDTTGAPPASP